MKTYPYTQILGLICAGALASCASQPEPVKMQVSASLRPDNTVSGQVFQGVNSYRLSQGKSQLQRHAGLDRLAQDHCEYLRKHRGTFGLYGTNVSHMGFDGRVSLARDRYQMENVSENVAAANHPGKAQAPVLVELWKGSKDHHKNMLDSWTYTGIGVVVDADGTVFATQLFSTMGSSQLSLRNRFNRF
jgi:uncharacterized protein YkwD